MTDAQPVISEEDYALVFERYLDICNRAIEQNKDKFPYMEIWRAKWKSLGTKRILQCAVYDDRPKLIYTLELTEDMKIKLVKKMLPVSQDTWPFTFSFLNHVVDNADDYITHPATLDWGWLTEVFG